MSTKSTPRWPRQFGPARSKRLLERRRWWGELSISRLWDGKPAPHEDDTHRDKQFDSRILTSEGASCHDIEREHEREKYCSPAVASWANAAHEESPNDYASPSDGACQLRYLKQP